MNHRIDLQQFIQDASCESRQKERHDKRQFSNNDARQQSQNTTLTEFHVLCLNPVRHVTPSHMAEMLQVRFPIQYHGNPGVISPKINHSTSAGPHPPPLVDPRAVGNDPHFAKPAVRTDP